MLLIESTDGAYQLPDKGLVGPQAIFDPAALDHPRIDEAFKAQQDENTWQIRIKRRGQISTVTYPYNPLDVVGWHGDNTVVRLNWRDIRPPDEPPLPPAAIGAHHLCRQWFCDLHLYRDRWKATRRVEGAVLSQQRRLRRSAVLPPW